MAKKVLKLWFDPEADFLEVTFEKTAGYFRATENDQVMEKVDEDGNVIGFSILQVSSLKKAPLEVALQLSPRRKRRAVMATHVHCRPVFGREK